MKLVNNNYLKLLKKWLDIDYGVPKELIQQLEDNKIFIINSTNAKEFITQYGVELLKVCLSLYPYHQIQIESLLFNNIKQ